MQLIISSDQVSWMPNCHGKDRGTIIRPSAWMDLQQLLARPGICLLKHTSAVFTILSFSRSENRNLCLRYRYVKLSIGVFNEYGGTLGSRSRLTVGNGMD